MKSKQLANVLIKIVGLSMVVHDIPGFLTVPYMTVPNFLIMAVSVALGIFLIVKSRDITAFLFKNEDDSG